VLPAVWQGEAGLAGASLLVPTKRSTLHALQGTLVRIRLKPPAQAGGGMEIVVQTNIKFFFFILVDHFIHTRKK
jgi:hypothetical protein